MAGLIRDVRPDIIALQEVTLGNFEPFSKRIEFESRSLSLNLRSPEPGEGRGRRLGCAIFARAPFSIASCAVLSSVPFPERTLVAQVDTSSTRLTTCSFHAPPGASWGKLKPQSFVAIADWLSHQVNPASFGIDANTPKADRFELAENVWWWKDEPSLLGTNAQHPLRDVLRTLLASDARRLADARQARPQGPLAVSFRRGRRARLIDCRYDFICATPDIVVRDVSYFYEESIAAGSDHALVVADLELRDQ